jgi:hypothetical protein
VKRGERDYKNESGTRINYSGIQFLVFNVDSSRAGLIFSLCPSVVTVPVGLRFDLCGFVGLLRCIPAGGGSGFGRMVMMRPHEVCR